MTQFICLYQPENDDAKLFKKLSLWKQITTTTCDTCGVTLSTKLRKTECNFPHKNSNAWYLETL